MSGTFQQSQRTFPMADFNMTITHKTEQGLSCFTLISSQISQLLSTLNISSSFGGSCTNHTTHLLLLVSTFANLRMSQGCQESEVRIIDFILEQQNSAWSFWQPSQWGRAPRNRVLCVTHHVQWDKYPLDQVERISHLGL